MPWMTKNAGAAFALSALGLICASGPADAASKPIYFDESSIVGIGQTITALRVPIETAAGTYIYKDVTIEINSDAKGDLTWATAEPITALSPPLATSNVRAGIYVIPTCACGIQITGPSSIGSGGVGEWVITAVPGKSTYYSPPNPAFFYTGSLAASPLAARLEKAGLTSPQYVYGIVGTSNSYIPWQSNALFGLRLVGNELVVAAFTDGSNIDHNVPVTQIIYTFSQ
jgi:hypothetical protein